MKFIKNSACILALFFITIANAQNKELDSLIQKIDNKDAYVVLTTTTSPRIKGFNANRILEIGKIASPELIKILDTENKGIIAHFILSKIWQNSWDEEVCCNIKNIRNIEILLINGLEIQIENNILYATIESLKSNKQVWKKFCQV